MGYGSMTEHPTPAASNYAYVSITQFQKTLEIFTKMRPERIDQNFLTKYGIPAGSVFTVTNALRFFHITDDNDKVLNPQILVQLGNLQQRQAALRELVDTAYADVLRQQHIETATVSDIDLFFQYQGIRPNVSIKAARFFMWVAQQAGYTVGEPVQPMYRAALTNRAQVRRENGQLSLTETQVEIEDDTSAPVTSSKHPAQASLNKYEEELLQILLANMKESKTVPDTELLKEIQKLISIVKGESPPRSG